MPSPAELLSVLLSRLGESAGNFTQVLDDYEKITKPDIHAALANLVDHAPAELPLILISWVAPELLLALAPGLTPRAVLEKFSA